MIACQRHRFTIPGNVHYLNNAYMAPLAHEVVEAIERGARLKATPWNFRPADFFTLCEDFRASAARLIEAPTDNLAIVPSASYGLAIAARNLPVAKGQQIVTLAEQFPSNVYVWRELARRSGAEALMVRRGEDECWSAAVLGAITERTAIVAVPHCHWADGRIVDLEAVADKCRDHGSALVLDLTQSLGAMPIDLARVQPDFAVAACYKWLMGPYGIGVLYVDPKHHDKEPLEHNWINRAGSQDFARLVDYREDFQPGARRFDMGEKSNPPLLMGAIAAFDFLREFGVEAIARTLGERTRAIGAQAARLGLVSAEIGQRAPHFLALGFPQGVPEGLAESLAAKNVHVSLRGSSLRVTPHLYTNDGDAGALIDALR